MLHKLLVNQWQYDYFKRYCPSLLPHLEIVHPLPLEGSAQAIKDNLNRRLRGAA